MAVLPPTSYIFPAVLCFGCSSSRALSVFQTGFVSSSVLFPDVLLGQAVILFPHFLHPRAPGTHSQTLGECPDVFEAALCLPSCYAQNSWV